MLVNDTIPNPMDTAAIHRLMALELEKVDSLAALVVDAAESELDHLGSATDDGLDDFAEEAHELFELRALFSQLSAVALYSVVEIRTKAALKGLASEAELRDAFRIKAVHKLFQTYARAEVALLPHYSEIDELRCVSNSFKHNGFVNSELAAHSGWILDRPLGNIEAAIRRIRPLVPVYLSAVVAALHAPGP